MKTTLFTLLVCALVLTLACNNDHSHDGGDHGHETVDKINTTDTISEYKFNKWKKAWEKDGGVYKDTSALFQYFTMPVVDFQEVLAENATGTKFYFGLEKLAKDHYEMKFMLVGTDKKGADLIDYAGNNHVYDYSKLCPPVCPN